MHVAMTTVTPWWHFANVSQRRAIAQLLKRMFVPEAAEKGNRKLLCLWPCVHLKPVKSHAHVYNTVISSGQYGPNYWLKWKLSLLADSTLLYFWRSWISLSPHMFLYFCYCGKISSNKKCRPFVLMYVIKINHVWFSEEYWNSIEDYCRNHIWPIHSCARSNQNLVKESICYYKGYIFHAMILLLM